MGNLVFFNNRKDAGKFNQFIWSIVGDTLHVYQGERELPIVIKARQSEFDRRIGDPGEIVP